MASFFLWRGGFGPFLYGTVWHNLTPALGPSDRQPIRVLALALLVAGWRAADLLVRHGPSLRIGLHRAFVLLVVTAYVAPLIGWWPLVSRQDHLPAIPLVAVFVTAAIMALPMGRLASTAGMVLAVAIELTAVVLNGSVRGREAGRTVAFETDVLRLVPAGETVLDPKGDTIFRPRAIYWVFEGITKARLRQGLLTDDFAGRLVDMQVHVVAGNAEKLPAEMRRWVRTHYLRVARYPGVGGVFVAGARLDGTGEFDVGIPARYALVAPSGTPHGVLDGRPYRGPRDLEPGLHSYRPADGESRVALFYSNAADQAFLALRRGGELAMIPCDPLDLARLQRLLVIAPHPDDETLAAGGLLQRSIAAGGTVRVVLVTDGKNNPWPQRMIERKWRLGPKARTRWAARRRAETLEALDCLGVPASSTVFLQFPDQGLTSLLLAGGGRLVSALVAELADVATDAARVACAVGSTSGSQRSRGALASRRGSPRGSARRVGRAGVHRAR